MDDIEKTEEEVEEESLSERELEIIRKVESAVVPGVVPSRTTKEAPPIDLVDFVGDTPIDELLEHPAKLNAMLSKVYQHAVKTTRESVLTEVRSLVEDHVDSRLRAESLVNDFYGANKDIAQMKKTFGGFLQVVAHEKPELSLDAALEEAATRVRAAFNIGKKAKKPKSEERSSPAFAGQHGRTTEVRSTEKSPLQQQIATMLQFT